MKMKYNFNDRGLNRKLKVMQRNYDKIQNRMVSVKQLKSLDTNTSCASEIKRRIHLLKKTREWIIERTEIVETIAILLLDYSLKGEEQDSVRYASEQCKLHIRDVTQHIEYIDQQIEDLEMIQPIKSSFGYRLMRWIGY